MIIQDSRTKYDISVDRGTRENYKHDLESFIRKTAVFSGIQKVNIYEKISEIIPKKDENYQNFKKAESYIRGGFEYTDNCFSHQTVGFEDMFKNLNLLSPNIKYSRISNLIRGNVKCKLFGKMRVANNTLPLLVNQEEPWTLFFTIFTDALCSLTAQPGLIMRIIDNECVNYTGVYSTWIFKNYEWVNVLIDDYIPVQDSSKIWVPILSSLDLGNVEVWQFLLEKTYARTNPCFYDVFLGRIKLENLASNFKKLIVELTGGIASTFKVKDIDIMSKIRNENLEHVNTLWSKVVEALNEGSLVTAIPRHEGENFKNFVKPKKRRKGLSLKHCYSVLKLVEVTKFKGNASLYLIKLKSAWENDLWSGEWSRNWYQWTPELKAMVDFKEDTHDIWMNLKDFFRYFGDIIICKVKLGYSRYKEKIEYPHQKVSRMVIRFNYETEGKHKTFISLFQNKNEVNSDSRDNLFKFESKKKEKKKYLDIKMVLGKFHEGKYRFLSYCNSVNSSLATMSKNLISGEYFILIEYLGDAFNQIDSNLSIYADGKVGMKLIENEEESVVYDFIAYKTWLYYSDRTEGHPMSEISLAVNQEESKVKLEPIPLQLSKIEVPGCAIFCVYNPSHHLIKIDVKFDGSDDMEILAFKGLIKRNHTVVIDSRSKEIFILRHNRQNLGIFDEDIPKFKLGCSNLEVFCPPKPEDEKDMLIYNALVDDMPEQQMTGIEILKKFPELKSLMMERQMDTPVNHNLSQLMSSYLSGSERSPARGLISPTDSSIFYRRKLSIQRSLFHGNDFDQLAQSHLESKYLVSESILNYR